MTTKDEMVPMTVIVPKSLVEQLKKLAKTEDRKLSSFVRIILKKTVDGAKQN